MLINLTQEDIDEQTRRHCYKCGLALAIRRATGKPFGVALTTAFIDGTRYQLPPEAITARLSLDNGYFVSPMSFEFPDEPIRPEAACSSK